MKSSKSWVHMQVVFQWCSYTTPRIFQPQRKESSAVGSLCVSPTFFNNSKFISSWEFCGSKLIIVEKYDISSAGSKKLKKTRFFKKNLTGEQNSTGAFKYLSKELLFRLTKC